MTYAPGTLNLTASRETGLQLGLPVTEYGVPVDLTDWVFDMEIGTRCDDPALVITGTPDGGGSSVYPDETMIAIDITPASLAAIGNPAAHQESYFYSLFATQPTSFREQFLAGTFLIRRD